MTTICDDFYSSATAFINIPRHVENMTEQVFGLLAPAYDAVTAAPKKFYQMCISYCTMTSLRLDKKELTERREQLLARYPDQLRFIEVPTEDNFMLDGVYLPHPEKKTPGKVMIVLWGISGCYERDFERLRALQDKFEMDLLSINYRGVGRSEGFPLGSEDLIKDAKAVIKYVEDTYQIPSDHMVICGSSMGGAVGAQIMAEFARKGRRIHLISDRSFSTFADAIKSNAVRVFGNSLFFQHFFSKLAEYAGWALDSVKALQDTLNTDMDIEVVILYHHHDSIIPPSVSLANAYSELESRGFLKKNRKVNVIRLDAVIEDDPHTCMITEPSFRDQINICKEIFQKAFEILHAQAQAG